MENKKVEKLLSVLNGWVDKEFNPGVSAQCAAFTRAAWKEAGLVLPVTEHPDDVYADTNPNLANSFAGNEIGPKVEVRDIRPGDIIMFKNTYGNYPPGTITHVGTCVGGGMMVDRPTSAKPVLKRSIFTFGQRGIAQIRRPALLQEETKSTITPITVCVVTDTGNVKISCNPQIVEDKIRVDLRSICNFLGFNVEYIKDKNLVYVRRK